jgi:hypothetical protein
MMEAKGVSKRIYPSPLPLMMEAKRVSKRIYLPPLPLMMEAKGVSKRIYPSLLPLTMEAKEEKDKNKELSCAEGLGVISLNPQQRFCFLPLTHNIRNY